MLELLYLIGYLYLALGVTLLVDGPMRHLAQTIVTKAHLTHTLAEASLHTAAGCTPYLVIYWMDTVVSHSQLGLGTILGSCVFNVTVLIPVYVWFQPPASITLNTAKIRRTGGFYLLAGLIFWLTTRDGHLTPWKMWTLVTVYLSYLVRLLIATPVETSTIPLDKGILPRGGTEIPTESDEPSGCTDRLLCWWRCVTVRGWELCFKVTLPTQTGYLTPVVVGVLISLGWMMLLTYGLVWLATYWAVKLNINTFWAGGILVAPTLGVGEGVVRLARISIDQLFRSNIFNLSIGYGAINLVYTVLGGSQLNHSGAGEGLIYVGGSALLLLVIGGVSRFNLTRAGTMLLGVAYLGRVIAKLVQQN